ncbi:MAG TPA: VCBS repeat-containing protein [Candidatus Obscuribacterales bacterium]
MRVAAIGAVVAAGMGLIIGLPLLFPDKAVQTELKQATEGQLKLPADKQKDLFDTADQITGENVRIKPSVTALENGYALRPLMGLDSRVAKFEILHNGKVVYSKDFEGESDDISIISPLIAGESEPVSGTLPMTRDITGDGIPDLVVLDYTGGAHCCYEYSIFSLGDQFKKLATLDGRDSPMTFQDIDGDGVFEVRGRDSTFAYWNAAFVDSVLPAIVLRFREGKYELASNIMRSPAPERSLLEERIRQIREDMKPQSPGTSSPLNLSPSLWNCMLELVYSGNGNLAWKVLEEVWPAGKAAWSIHEGEVSRDQFLRRFKSQLATSPYWPDIKELNHWS